LGGENHRNDGSPRENTTEEGCRYDTSKGDHNDPPWIQKFIIERMQFRALILLPL
jgi:hypothetical protein